MNGYLNCPCCGANIENDSDSPRIICEYCRSEIENPFYVDAQYSDPNVTDGASVRKCRECGSVIYDGESRCRRCGAPVLSFNSDAIPRIFNYTSNKTRPKNKWVALFLCAFFGYLGAHKFYEERYLAGIFYFFTFGFCFIGVVVDLIALAAKPNTYYI